jgi:hypothetical protein
MMSGIPRDLLDSNPVSVLWFVELTIGTFTFTLVDKIGVSFGVETTSIKQYMASDTASKKLTLEKVGGRSPIILTIGNE